MRTLLAATVAAFATLTSLPASAQSYGDRYGTSGGIVRCESNDGRTRECPTNGGRAYLVRQISRASCIEGRSWGQGRNGIWVSQGCRAEFEIRGYGGGDWGRPDEGYGERIRCESIDGRYRRCALPGRGRAQLVRQISKTACIEGRTWGNDRDGVWVADGCRAEFTSGGWQGGWNRPDYGYGARQFRCESIDGRRRECATNTRSGVELVRQLSRAACVQGRTWGYARNGIWVDDGCRAEFRSY